MTKCNRCLTEVDPATAEYCWWCEARLCGPCWDEVGHCGHPEADAINRASRQTDANGRRKMAEAMFGDDVLWEREGGDEN